MQLTVADGLKYFDRLIVACNFMSRPILNFENWTTVSKVSISFGCQIPSPKKVLEIACIFCPIESKKSSQKGGKWHWVLKMLASLRALLATLWYFVT